MLNKFQAAALWLWGWLVKFLSSFLPNANKRLQDGKGKPDGKQLKPPPAQIATNNNSSSSTAETEVNKLKNNISKKGENSYYYAHKNTRGAAAAAPMIVRNEPPKLLSSSSSSSSAGEVSFQQNLSTAFETFAWADSKKSVSVYIPFPQAESVDDGLVTITHEETAFRFELTHNANQYWLAKTKLHGRIQAATWKKKKDKFVITLQKKEDKGWNKLEQ